MSEILGVAGSFLIGMLTGGFYFAGLWWTVARLARARHPGRLMLASYLLRSGGVVVIFVFLTLQFEIWGIIAALPGFWLSRVLMIRRQDRRTAQPIHGRHG